ncbi:MAG: hypothetical protein PUE84_05445, partial [Firmicutes bacterium]|nr:hypothetical protein [Bacillota bacterium]
MTQIHAVLLNLRHPPLPFHALFCQFRESRSDFVQFIYSYVFIFNARGADSGFFFFPSFEQ